MKKIIYSALFAILFSISPGIYAAEQPIVGWKIASCMTIEQCKPLKDDELNKCTDGSAHLNRLRQDLSKGLPPNADVYLTECVKVSADEVYCTTADANLDTAIPPLFGHLDTLESRIEYNKLQAGEIRYYETRNSDGEIGNGFAKLVTDASGNLMLPGVNKKIESIEWRSHNPDVALPRNFALWTAIREEADTPSVDAGGLGGQQQSILSFPAEGGPGERCDSYTSYDPEGRVFDAVSLEPIPDVELTLLQRDTDGTFSTTAVDKFNTGIKIVNPIFTKSKNVGSLVNAPFLVGSFNFFVVDGFYKLMPKKADYTFETTSSLSRLPANVSKIYSEIYFSDSAPIEQEGKLEHRDIPLFPVGGVGKTYHDTFHLLFDTTILVSPTKELYDGQVSHPFAKATREVCSSTTGVEVCSDQIIIPTSKGGPDKNGKFSIEFDQSLLKPGERYKVSFSPVNLNEIIIANEPSLWGKIISFISSVALVPKVSAQTKSVSRYVEPIPSYIEGYAYDLEGNILPNADVHIRVPFATGPLVETKSDEKGYYKITSEFLPKSEYTLAYNKLPGSSQKTNITTSEYLQQNKQFIAAEKINPYLAVTRSTDPRQNITPTFEPSTKISPIVNQTITSGTPVTTGTNEAKTTTSSSKNSMFLIGAVLLLLVATAGTLIGIHLYKKRTQETPEM